MGPSTSTITATAGTMKGMEKIQAKSLWFSSGNTSKTEAPTSLGPVVLKREKKERAHILDRGGLNLVRVIHPVP